MLTAFHPGSYCTRVRFLAVLCVIPVKTHRNATHKRAYSALVGCCSIKKSWLFLPKRRAPVFETAPSELLWDCSVREPLVFFTPDSIVLRVAPDDNCAPVTEIIDQANDQMALAHSLIRNLNLGDGVVFENRF